jgi:hypothetical protein
MAHLTVKMIQEAIKEVEKEIPLQIEMKATKHLTEIDGVPVRLWEGVTDDGIKCKVFVHRIAVHNELNAEAFEKELDEKMPLGVKVSIHHIM